MPGRHPIFRLLLGLFIGTPLSAGHAVTRVTPDRLTFSELQILASEDPPPPGVREHLDRVLSEPVIDNQPSLSGAAPKRPEVPGIGPVLRIAEWNVNHGLNEPAIRLALTDAARFERAARTQASPDSGELTRLPDELRTFQNADVLILDEVDLGLKRTRYHDIARDLAQSLHMNYTFAVEFVELNRLYLAAKKLDIGKRANRHDETGPFGGIDPNRYLGLEGAAILSRYPIRSARIIRLPECYDWYHGEIKQVSTLEQVKRWSADKIFDERVRRQVRRGGRMAIIAEIAVPESPTETVTVANVHLEDYCPPTCRRTQMDYLLEQISNTPGPVVVSGDLNTSGHDGTPTSFRREILKRLRSYRFWVREAIWLFAPVPFAGVIAAPINAFKNYHDPTAFNVKFIAPNREKALFSDTRAVRFADGGQFDFAGATKRSFQDKGRTLADSNQRAWKGFAGTYAFRRTLFHLVGSFKMDWFFVKPPRRSPEPGPFSPYFGRTLKEVDTALGGRISDHYPIVTDLPLTTAPVSTRHP